jgi:hypothetical protein
MIRGSKATASIGVFSALADKTFSKAVVTLDQNGTGSASVVGYAAIKNFCKGAGQNVI